MRISARLTIILIATISTLAGCGHDPAPIKYQPHRDLVWMLPGVEGGPWSMAWAKAAFRDAGVKSEIEVFDWQRPFGTLQNLTDYPGNRQKAVNIAGEIIDYRRNNPNAAIDIVGYSGGGGLAIMVAEALPDAVHLRNVVLAQPAISPDYDLRAALSRIDGKLINFYSSYDWVILGWGTKLFGTMDRKEVPSAGKERFDLAMAVRDPRLRNKVVQHGWDVEMFKHGHLGGHFSILSYWWNKQYIAPYLLPEPRESK